VIIDSTGFTSPIQAIIIPAEQGSYEGAS